MRLRYSYVWLPQSGAQMHNSIISNEASGMGENNSLQCAVALLKRRCASQQEFILREKVQLTCITVEPYTTYRHWRGTARLIMAVMSRLVDLPRVTVRGTI